MKRPAMILTGALLLVVSACQNREPINPGFGDSVRRNMSVHIINPHPDYAGRRMPGMSGPRAAGAMRRYYEGKVTDVKVESTSKKSSSK